MSPKIVKRYLRLLTASEILSALTKALYDESENYKFFYLKQRSFAAKKNGRPLFVYYGELIEIFRELDHRVIKLL